MNASKPSTLTEIDKVAVVDLQGIKVNARDFVDKSSNAPSVNVRGATAQKIASLWRSLPPGMQARCHMPPLGLRFSLRGKIVWQASLCWKCKNAYGERNGESVFFAFDGNDKVSRELLSLLEEILGHPVAEE